MSTIKNANAATTSTFESTMQMTVQIGFKRFAMVPISLLEIDERYQRSQNYSDAVVKRLAAHWDTNKMDALRVSVHSDEGRFMIVDGMHRYLAAKQLGNYGALPCELLDLENAPEGRLAAEAKLFATQFTDTEKLTAEQTHNAKIILHDPTALVIDKAIHKYKIALKNNKGRGLAPAGTLASYSAASEIVSKATTAELDPQEYLDSTFEIICGSRWNLQNRGFSKRVMRAISTNLLLHNDHKDEIKRELIKYFRKVNPEIVQANAVSRYDRQETTTAMVLYVEDYLVEKLSIPVLYKADDITIVRPSKQSA